MQISRIIDTGTHHRSLKQTERVIFSLVTKGKNLKELIENGIIEVLNDKMESISYCALRHMRGSPLFKIAVREIKDQSFRKKLTDC